MRSESLYFLFSPVTRIKGIGPKAAKDLARLLPAVTAREENTVPLVRDLLFHLPVAILDRRFTCPLREAKDGVVATFVVTVNEHLPPKRRGKSPYKVMCSNETGDITLIFFHASEDYLLKALPVGQQRVISGKVEHFDFHIQMSHPDIIAPVSQLAEVQKVEPVYPLTIGLTSRRIHTIVMDALEKLPKLEEWAQEFPPPSFREALIQVHNPQSLEDLSPLTPARARLAYDELLANQLHLAQLRQNMQRQKGEVITGTGKITEGLQKSLPYKLTAGQEKALKEISDDMASGHRMGRLLQGDVGSGKTIVALLAMLHAVEQGLQCALMVPTELIAQQHYEVISKLLAFLPSPLEGEGAEHSEAGEGLSGRGYDSTVVDRARELRKNSTEVEKKLWNILRNRQLEQYKFRRQQPVGPYIVDFICQDKMLVVELDGGQHTEQQPYDERRTKFLESKGYHVLRFWNNEITESVEGVYDKIYQIISTPHPALRATLSLKGRGISVTLLTGSVKGKERAQILQNIANGEAKIIIGTHALFQEKVVFKNLALVVIDEQHRFGVEQRMALSNKGNLPHILHMTATPIPRSLAMTLYGDMDSSLLREKPAGRKPITTRAIPAARYDTVVERLKAALDRGEKAYWICPLIESGDDSDKDLAAAKHRFTEFKTRFGNIVGLVHGRMKKDERDAEMQKFVSGKTKLLVATTVIEVGVDVRDATIMVIEQAERFGLSQLHQLRGRVGRGEKPSACALLYNEYAVMRPSLLAEEIPAATRLAIVCETEDGFKIAEEDLKLRGGGDLLGTRQSGGTRFIFTDMQHHLPLLMQANEDSKILIRNGITPAQHTLLQLFGWE
jgi:RecG-like helicase/very-short-patch-repair endonuclease